MAKIQSFLLRLRSKSEIMKRNGLRWKLAKLLLFLQKRISRGIIRNIDTWCEQKIGRALLYYKTDPFVSKLIRDSFDHANNAEIVLKVKVLNQMGYVVDLVDRSVPKSKLKFADIYDLYIGLGAGDSGKFYDVIADQVPSAKRIIYAAGPYPPLSNRLILRRYDMLRMRTGASLKPLRMIKYVDFQRFVTRCDAIFVVGNSFSIHSYGDCKKPLYRMYGVVSPHIAYNKKTKDLRKFLFFGGNGQVVKGLDLVLDAFKQLPEFELYVCGPFEGETEFYELYKPVTNLPNIHLEGFVFPASKRFKELTEQCAWIISPSCSEGTANSVMTCMRAGLIPICTYETGVDMEDFGFLVKDSVTDIKETVIRASLIDETELLVRQGRSVDATKIYTKESYSNQFERCIREVLECVE